MVDKANSGGKQHPLASTVGSLDGERTSPLICRSQREERWNCGTHAAGAVLSLVGAVILVPAQINKSMAVVAASSLFGGLLVVVYGCSALSHYFSAPDLRSLFRRLDQAFIYLLIVASYTPFSVAHQHGFWWSFVLMIMWTIAIAGFVSKLFYSHRVDSVAIWIYLLLGWLPVLSGMPFAGLIPEPAIWLILAGGFFYTAGTFFLFYDRRAWYYHSIWHLFVIAGSVTHYLAVKWYV